jgi:hypothetical protein
VCLDDFIEELRLAGMSPKLVDILDILHVSGYVLHFLRSS